MTYLRPLLFGLLLPCVALAHPPAEEPAAASPSLVIGGADGPSLPPEVLEALRKARAERGNTSGPQRIVLSAEQGEAMRKLAEGQRQAGQAMRKGRVFPQASLATIDGGSIPLRGRRTVVNFWATWCAPCLTEMPLFEKLAAERPDLGVVTINNDFARADLDGWLAKRAFTLPVHFDDGNAIAAELGVRSWPTTLILDENGTIVDELSGEVKSYAALEEKFGAPRLPAAQAAGH